MLLGIDDTDSPSGMCTTYLGAVLARRLIRMHMPVREARLLRLNPNVIYKTRGNAAICLEVEGNTDLAFETACGMVEELAHFSNENTNPGIVAVENRPGPDFYWKAVRDFCTTEEAIAVLEAAGARYKGFKNGRGLIGATAAVCSELPDRTYEYLTYREDNAFGSPRFVDRESLFEAQASTFPHTWDTVDIENNAVVCVPHTPDPVLFGIRGESPSWVAFARMQVNSEPTGVEQIFVTNQGTDSHLIGGNIGALTEGLSYRVTGIVCSHARTGRGGHVSIEIGDGDLVVRCMAYEPTKWFRDVLRALWPGDRVLVTGSYKGGSINLEKACIIDLAPAGTKRPPVCPSCGARMTSAGLQKGYKCRKCGARVKDPEVTLHDRTVTTGWYEVPPVARRHLAKPLCRGP
jgi:tRNA(Ile2)-agmatinylcytidine synthase